MMKKTNAKRILAAALAGMMALSLSAAGNRGEALPQKAQPQKAHPQQLWRQRRQKRKQGQRQSHRIPGKPVRRQPEAPPPGGCVPGGLGGHAEGACLRNNIKLSV